ncbi:unnamed protein product [Lampetra planeri]
MLARGLGARPAGAISGRLVPERDEERAQKMIAARTDPARVLGMRPSEQTFHRSGQRSQLWAVTARIPQGPRQ